MAWIRMTRMVERKTKDGARGELRLFAFAGVSPIWVAEQHIAAISTFKGTVYVDDWETEDRDITEIRLAGTESAVYVSEHVDAVLEQLGIDNASAP